MDQIDINNIKPYDKNAKKHPEKQLKKLAEIVKEVGWRQLTGTKPKELKHRPKFKYALTVSKLEQAFSIGCTVSEACLYAEIGRNSYYRWTKNNKILKDRFEALKEKPILQARQTIVSNLKDNVDVARWYLEKKKTGSSDLSRGRIPRVKLIHS